MHYKFRRYFHDEKRKSTILDKIEAQTIKEKLFFWPICLYSYEKPEGNDWHFPFPNYENGDLFHSWGSVGVEAYAPYKPEIALKYIKNVMEQHAKDGLAFQHSLRAKTGNKENVSLDIKTFTSHERSWKQYSLKEQKVIYTLRDLQPDKLYRLEIDFQFVKVIKSNKHGEVTFAIDADKKKQLISMKVN